MVTKAFFLHNLHRLDLLEVVLAGLERLAHDNARADDLQGNLKVWGKLPQSGQVIGIRLGSEVPQQLRCLHTVQLDPRSGLDVRFNSAQ